MLLASRWAIIDLVIETHFKTSHPVVHMVTMCVYGHDTCLWKSVSSSVGRSPIEYHPKNSIVENTCLTIRSEKWIDL